MFLALDYSIILQVNVIHILNIAILNSKAEQRETQTRLGLYIIFKEQRYILCL